LDALAEMRFPERVLSMYVPTDQGAERRRYPAVIHDLVRSALLMLDEPDQIVLGRELSAVQTAFAQRRSNSPAVALFSSGPHGFLRVWHLSDPVPCRLMVGDELDLTPIRCQLLIHPPALAVVVDERHAWLDELVLDELVEVERPHSHLVEVAGAISRLSDRNGHRRLILAGPPEGRAALKLVLPALALGLLTAEASIPMCAAGDELAGLLHSLDRRPAAV
jgi:hypothetical protein